jgi:hypothetical protein
MNEEHDDSEWQQAAEAGARPQGVPLRVYGGYLEARAALRGNAPQAATRVLEWLLGYLAEERGAKPDLAFATKVERLKSDGVITSAAVLETMETTDQWKRAWGLLSITEHALTRLYLRPGVLRANA